MDLTVITLKVLIWGRVHFQQNLMLFLKIQSYHELCFLSKEFFFLAFLALPFF